MKKGTGKPETHMNITRIHLGQILLILASIGFLYMICITFEMPFIFMGISNTTSSVSPQNAAFKRPQQLHKKTPTRPIKKPLSISPIPFNLIFDEISGLNKSKITAFQLGNKLWEDLKSGKMEKEWENRNDSLCINSVMMSGAEFMEKGKVMILQCGLKIGSEITVVGKLKKGLKDGDQQFMLELIGLKNVDGEEEEDPPKILHYNVRLKGDWSKKPVIEMNTRYRQQWGTSIRCQGSESKIEEETVDGLIKCEKWISDNDSANASVVKIFPFVEDKFFVMTLSAGSEGYHVKVDGSHVTSFLYRTGFSIEDATEMTLKGDIDVNYVSASYLPSSHVSYAQRHLEMSSEYQAPTLPNDPVELFIGVLSGANHFAERMSIRKSWMQHSLIKSSKVATRFFLALHARKEVNVDMKKEAEFFGDIVIVPYMDSYDLIVLKTVAIFEYGVGSFDAKHIMKCDDDTFVRVDAVIKEVNKIPEGNSFYLGNFNYYVRPMRSGKWAVTFEEWPDEYYPNYVTGPGYILSSDIAHFIVSKFKKHKLRLFKMEDVSVGIWVERFNSSKPVKYVDNFKFVKYGCVEDYYTAHYQSPNQMICLWNNLQQLGRAICCYTR